MFPSLSGGSINYEVRGIHNILLVDLETCLLIESCFQLHFVSMLYNILQDLREELLLLWEVYKLFFSES